jgi:hypothetical protein
MVVEISPNFKVSKDLFPVGILMHEFFHLALRWNKKLMAQLNEVSEKNARMLTKLSKGQIPNRIFLEELLISSFIPEGYLSKKFLHLKVSSSPKQTKINNLLDLRRLVAYKMHDAAKKYSDHIKQIDIAYLELLIEAIK